MSGNSQPEVDFLVEDGEEIIPVKAKSEQNFQAKSQKVR
jgi:hypothetical protein